jgi:hypothetical protein
MATTEEVTSEARRAINDAMSHYFINLASGGEKIDEAKFIAAFLQMAQPWLFFAEASLGAVQDFIMKDVLHINLVNTLTALFYNRFTLGRENYEAYIKHLSQSFFTQEASDFKQSFMAEEYRNRLIDPETIEMLLLNNRSLVMLVSIVLYFETQLLADVLPKHRGEASG